VLSLGSPAARRPIFRLLPSRHSSPGAPEPRPLEVGPRPATVFSASLCRLTVGSLLTGSLLPGYPLVGFVSTERRPCLPGAGVTEPVRGYPRSGPISMWCSAGPSPVLQVPSVRGAPENVPSLPASCSTNASPDAPLLILRPVRPPFPRRPRTGPPVLSSCSSGKPDVCSRYGPMYRLDTLRRCNAESILGVIRVVPSVS